MSVPSRAEEAIVVVKTIIMTKKMIHRTSDMSLRLLRSVAILQSKILCQRTRPRKEKRRVATRRHGGEIPKMEVTRPRANALVVKKCKKAFPLDKRRASSHACSANYPRTSRSNARRWVPRLSSCPRISLSSFWIWNFYWRAETLLLTQSTN